MDRVCSHRARVNNGSDMRTTMSGLHSDLAALVGRFTSSATLAAAVVGVALTVGSAGQASAQASEPAPADPNAAPPPAAPAGTSAPAPSEREAAANPLAQAQLDHIRQIVNGLPK